MKSICYISGILEIILDGYAVVTSKFLEGMKKSGFVFESISNSIDPEFLEEDLHEFFTVKHEDNVPTFVCTIIRFKDTELPPLENGDGKSDNEIIAIDKQTRNGEEQEEDMDLVINSPTQVE